MKESLVVRDLRKQLKACCGPNMWIKKINPGEFNEPGIPDLVGTFKGRGFGIEAKSDDRWPVTDRGAVIPRGRFTKDQLINLSSIAAAGGVSFGFVAVGKVGIIIPTDYLINTAYPITKGMLLSLVDSIPQLQTYYSQGEWATQPIIDYLKKPITASKMLQLDPQPEFYNGQAGLLRSLDL